MQRSDRIWQAVDRFAAISTIIASLVVVWLVSSSRPGLPREAVAATSPIQEIDGLLPADLVNGASAKGQPGARLAIVEFSDYQCPFCGKNAREVHPELQRDYIDTGQVKYVFLNFPLQRIHPLATKAAEAAECAGRQKQFWGMHDRLFANQQALMQSDLHRYAEELGLNRQEFDSCLDGAMSSKVREDIAMAATFAIESTPSFLIGDVQPDGSIKVRHRLMRALPYEAFKTVLDN